MRKSLRAYFRHTLVVIAERFAYWKHYAVGPFFWVWFTRLPFKRELTLSELRDMYLHRSTFCTVLGCTELESAPGRNLDQLALDWLEGLGVVNASRLPDPRLRNIWSLRNGVVVLGFSFVRENVRSPISIFRAIYFGLLFLLLRISVVVPLPDLYWLRANFFTSLIVVLSSGVHLVATNAPREALRYGIPRFVGPVFWTLPSTQLILPGDANWESRPKRIILPGSGDPLRREIYAQAVRGSEQSGYEVWWSNSKNIHFEHYREVVQNSRAISSTTSLQAVFYRGTRKYLGLISPHVATGRVWEGFSARILVITDPCPLLENLGFVVGYHFLDLSEFLPDFSRLAEYGDHEQERIANAGHELFLRLIANQEQQLRSTANL